MKQSCIKFTVLLICLTLAKLSFSIPATPYPVKVTQPDGSELTIRIKGDEFFRYKTTLDNYLIVNDEDGFYSYALKNDDGTLRSSKVRVSNIESRTQEEKNIIASVPQTIDYRKINDERRASKVAALSTETTLKKAFPLNGTPKSLVILVEFKDKGFTVSNPKTAFSDLLNKNGYSDNNGTGSARDYFRSASNGVFDPEFDVVGPFTLPNNMAYYGGNDSSGDDTNPRQMIIDACNLASTQGGVDFSNYDVDNDGYVDNIFVYYAGHNEAENASANTIWPHRWVLANSNTVLNGKIIYDYACTSELKGSSGSNMCGIGTFCHEFGHVLGLPDYYITSGTGTHYTPSYWNIMDYGAYLNGGKTPPTYSAFDRFFLDWLTPIELSSAANGYLPALNTSNKAYLVSQNGNHNLIGSNPNPVEFFMFENRQQTGWDSYLPGHGMLITHIYYNKTNWWYNTVNNTASAMGYDIVEADNIATDNSLTGDPFPGTSNVTSYNPVLRSGVDIGKPITFINETTDGIIKFRFMGGKDVPVIMVDGTFNQFSTEQGTPSDYQTIKISGEKLQEPILIKFTTNLNYELQQEGDATWSKSISLNPVNSIVASVNVFVRYNPTSPSFASIHSDKITLSSYDAESVQLTVNGKSTRKVYVVPPIAAEATSVTQQAFIANWEKVLDNDRDAAGYYLTVYGVGNGDAQQTEGFDAGLTAPMDWKITATGITSTAAYSGKSKPAIQFKNSDEYIETEKYVLPVSGLSFFARSMSETSGKLVIDAWSDESNSWTNVYNLNVTASLNDTIVYNFNSSLGYNKFKLSYVKGAGYLAVDDVRAKFDKKLNLIEKNKWITELNDTINNLLPEYDYYYKLRASDKTLNSDKSVKYENITDYSNVVQVKTLSETQNKLLRTKVENDGSVAVILPDETQTIFVYNVMGQKIKEVNGGSNVVYVYGLPKNQIYIFKAGDKIAKIVY
jgi:M6 family metalloprotease-like protein